jgi:hypothetical protein
VYVCNNKITCAATRPSVKENICIYHKWKIEKGHYGLTASSPAHSTPSFLAPRDWAAAQPCDLASYPPPTQPIILQLCAKTDELLTSQNGPDLCQPKRTSSVPAKTDQLCAFHRRHCSALPSRIAAASTAPVICNHYGAGHLRFVAPRCRSSTAPATLHRA